MKRNTNGINPIRNVNCIIVESSRMNVYRGKLDTAFQDFIPWADPYITSLVEKVRRSQGRLLDEAKDERRDPETDR